ncbi:PREDICTED: probable protein S-acyltransferase 16 isoform X3 [Nelumbo nucifera]|uniref:S-acyltransferase n=1 Tax=Nelumbo nucifera TaxID=4432 RepID=A0A1U8AB60_NELNU|nr:PREDICTED: probable protein S-acyltransferase 16 isoform X3 [Nelumbo nucifera]
MRRSCSISLPILVVLSAIAYIYYTTVFIFIEGWFGLRTSPGLMNAVILTVTAFMCIFNYVIAIVRDPGLVPATFMPDIEDAETPVHEIKRKGGDLRYCQKCSHFKPPRAHHCRICKRCVLRMVLLFGSFVQDAQKDEEQIRDSTRTIYIISGLLLVPLSVALSILLGWHIYLILWNKTTIEYHEGVRAMWLAEKVGNVYQHPYDLGPYENLTSVLGPNIFTWLCPTARHIGSGLRFRTVYDKMVSASTMR